MAQNINKYPRRNRRIVLTTLAAALQERNKKIAEVGFYYALSLTTAIIVIIKNVCSLYGHHTALSVSNFIGKETKI